MIEFSSVSKHNPDGTVAVNDVSLSVAIAPPSSWWAPRAPREAAVCSRGFLIVSGAWLLGHRAHSSFFVSVWSARRDWKLSGRPGSFVAAWARTDREGG
jgi:hypothetical protein